MLEHRKLAIATATFFLITHVTSVPAGLLFTPVLENPSLLLQTVARTSLLWGAWLEVVCSLAVVGTAVALYPVVRQRNEAMAVGYVGLRTLEAGVIAVGVVPLLVATGLLVVPANAEAGLAPLIASLVGLHEWTRLVGPGLICGTNTLVLAYLLYASRLVPRFVPILGLIGGPLVFIHSTAQLLGVSDQVLSWTTLAVIPIFAWELSLALSLLLRGFSQATPAVRKVAITGAVGTP